MLCFAPFQTRLTDVLHAPSASSPTILNCKGKCQTRIHLQYLNTISECQGDAHILGLHTAFLPTLPSSLPPSLHLLLSELRWSPQRGSRKGQKRPKRNHLTLTFISAVSNKLSATQSQPDNPTPAPESDVWEQTHITKKTTTKMLLDAHFDHLCERD